MRRRDFIKATIGVAAAWPLATRAQQPMPVIGYLSIGSPKFDAARLGALRQGLIEAGYTEGRNVLSDYRGAEGRNDRLPALAAELVRRRVAVIVAVGGPAPALAAKAATTTIPIVFTIPGDPIRQGLVASINRPGGNLTGVSNLAGVVVAKQFEVLHETMPKAALMGLLVNPTNPTVELYTKDAQSAAGGVGKKLLVVNASAENELEAAFAVLAKQKADAILVPSDALFNSLPDQLVVLSARYALPAIYAYSEFARIGGLMSYGVSFGEPFRLSGVYTGRILRGEKPADLPVMQGTKVELIVNLKTAKALNLAIPQTILARADEVIE